MFLLFGLFVLTAITTGQPDSTAYPIPGGLGDIFADLKGWFATNGGIIGLTIFATYYLAKFLKIEAAKWKQAVAIAISLALLTIGNLANFGFMADFDVLTTIIYGVIIGFSANGVYDLKNVAK